MTRNKLLTIIGLSLFCAVVFLPPLIHGYVYPNIGDDTAGHLAIFDKMQGGTIRPQMLYLGYVIVGYPLVFVSSLVGADINILFLWFNFVALAGVGLTVYFVISGLVDRLTGWLALLIVLFSAQGILFQFYFGQLFNLINVGIILPLLLLLVVKYLEQGKWYQLILLSLFSGLFGSFHTSGVYLPVIVGFTLVGYVMYCLLRKKRDLAKSTDTISLVQDI